MVRALGLCSFLTPVCVSMQGNLDRQEGFEAGFCAFFSIRSSELELSSESSECMLEVRISSSSPSSGCASQSQQPTAT